MKEATLKAFMANAKARDAYKGAVSGGMVPEERERRFLKWQETSKALTLAADDDPGVTLLVDAIETPGA